MNRIKDLHSASKGISVKQLFPCRESVAALQIHAGELLKEHITKSEALLVCISGKVVFENELHQSITLTEGAYLKIDAYVKHWVKGVEDSNLLLIK